MLNVRRTFFLFLAVLFQAQLRQAVAQPTTGEGPRYPGSTGQYSPYDTTQHRELQKRSQETMSLMERPIDPDKYLVGPNDILTVTIWTGSSLLYDVPVTPDAKLIIPRVGEVDVRDKTLSQAKDLVRNAVMRVYRTGDISLSLSRMREFKINVLGSVKFPGYVIATPSTRVSEAINLAGGGSTLASKRYVRIQRGNKRIDVDLLPYYAGDLESNPFVEGGDVVFVGAQDKKKIVTLYGAVMREGEYMYNDGDSVSSLIRYGFGFGADALLDSIEVVRTNQQGEIEERSIVQGLPDGTIIGDRPLRSGDRVFVRAIPNYLETNRIVVTGEVQHPGSYAIERGKTKLREIIERTGGFTADASIPDATLTRRTGIERDRRFDQIYQIDPEKRTPEEVEYFRTKSLEQPGAMTVNIPKLMAGDESENVTLVGEDSLYVPSRKDFVMMSGKFKNPGNVVFQPGRSYREYVELAGGYGWRADEGETRIIKAKTGDTFLASSSDYTLEPGDAIYVPEEQKSDFWDGFTKALTIFAQLATIVAVVLSIRASTK